MANIVALLAVSGMRIGEVLRLKPQDIHAPESTVLVRANKHGPDRLIPLHPTTVEALAKYESSPCRQTVARTLMGPSSSIPEARPASGKPWRIISSESARQTSHGRAQHRACTTYAIPSLPGR